MDQKKITLLGMSGVGKTYLSCLMAKWGWFHYSCDYEIGARFLRSELDGDVSFENLSALSRYIGKLGNPDKGGLRLDEFKRRQKAYYDAEVASLNEVADLSEKHQKFVNDSTGSLCEIEDEKLMERLGNSTLFVYIKANEEDERAVLQRAQDYPKPLFFPPSKFHEWLEEYLDDQDVNDIEPDSFARWVFPKLFASRLPKYQKLADKYGVTVQSSDLRSVQNEEDFLKIINQ